MRIAIFGSGGVGGYFGARLAEAGEDVHFIARGAHLDAIRANGLVIRSKVGDVTIHPAQATDDAASIGSVDLVFVAMKLYDTAGAADALPALMGPETAVVSFQNGVTAAEALANAVGAERVFGGAAYIMATIAEPGVIEHTGPVARLVFGEFDRSRSERVERFRAACENAGIQAEVSDDMMRDLWSKFALLTALSALTSVTRMPIGPIRETPQTRALLHSAIAETAAVGRAKGIALADDLADRLMAAFDRFEPEVISSTLYDLSHGKRLELPWLSGAVVRLGRETSTPTPTHAFVEAALVLHADGTPA